jgi:hypothetical protein
MADQKPIPGQEHERAVKVLIRRYDQAFKEGRFQDIADELDQTDVEEMHPILLVSTLMFSRWAKKQLGEARVRFVARATAVLNRTLGPERAGNILSRQG